jgi:hypothetical protein
METAERRNSLLYVALALVLVFGVAYTIAGLDGKSAANRVRMRGGSRAVLGKAKDFNVFDYSRDRVVTVAAVCVRIGESAAIFKEPEVAMSDEMLDRIRDDFDDIIFPANKQLGETGLLGLNGEKKLSILLLQGYRGADPDKPGQVVAGYFSNENEQLAAFRKESNQAKVIHLFVPESIADEDDVIDTVAHETRHLKNWQIAKKNIGIIISLVFAAATVMTLYLAISHMYGRSFN